MAIYAGASSGLYMMRVGGPTTPQVYYDEYGNLHLGMSNAGLIISSANTSSSMVNNNITPPHNVYTSPSEPTTVPPVIAAAPTYTKEDFNFFSVVEFLGAKTTLAGYPAFVKPANGRALFLLTMEQASNGCKFTIEENTESHSVTVNRNIFGKVCVKVSWIADSLKATVWGGGCQEATATVRAHQNQVSFEPIKIVPWSEYV